MELVRPFRRARYTEPAVFERERWPIFGSSWVHIAYDHQLRRTGDYVAENLAGWPIFVRRNDDGASSGSTTCARTVPARSCGTAKAIRPIWSAATTAGRSATPAGCSTPATSVATCPSAWTCTPIQVDSWRGMVFVCLDPDVPPLHEWLGDFPDEVAHVAARVVPLPQPQRSQRRLQLEDLRRQLHGGLPPPDVHPAMSRGRRRARTTRSSIKGDPRWNIHEMPPRDGSGPSACGVASGRRSRSTSSPGALASSGGCPVAITTAT